MPGGSERNEREDERQQRERVTAGTKKFDEEGGDAARLFDEE